MGCKWGINTKKQKSKQPQSLILQGKLKTSLKKPKFFDKRCQID